MSQTGQQPDARIWLLQAQWLMVIFALPRRFISAALKWMPCASQVRALSQPHCSR
jgi:hypothetical protein